ncbi:MAG: HAD-IC family P-type ATPase [Planctomycetes bacterium]|nr:HAD-IC family P-type ATPase [Planctomycetota bacterium]
MSASPQPQWHALPTHDVLLALEAEAGGLTTAQAATRIAAHGPNELPQKAPPPFWWVFLRQFNSPLIFILLAAAVVAMLLQEFTDAGFIFGVLMLNALIGSFQEWKAEKANRALQQLIVTVAVVVRDGDSREVPARELVPGDIVMVESGNRVPADVRLLGAHGLEVDESLLTGESLAVAKDPAWSPVRDAPLGDRRNMVFAGSVVARGRGRGVVVATGLQTMVGELALDVSGRPAGKPPLLQRLEKFTRLVGIVVLVASALVALLGVLVQNRPPAEMFLVAVALAVAAIPEGLPIALTVALAVATSRMAKRGVVVRKLAAVEGLGSCTLIASDKTGTLTANELTVRIVVPTGGDELAVTGVGYDPEGAIEGERRGELEALVRAGALCNEATLHKSGPGWVHRGDPTDVALLVLAHKTGVAPGDWKLRHELLNQIAFEAEHKFAATWHRGPDGEVRCCVKGAPERVAEMCADAPADWAEVAGDLAQRGFRVLALADLVQDGVSTAGPPPAPSGMRFLGLIGMIDPLRDGVKEAIDGCQRAGIRVSMVTGDHPVTALAIARELGFAQDRSQVISGDELEKLSPAQLAESIKTTRVFARTSPQQKLHIVEAAHTAGEFVAVTGDGVNDAPALRAANIGVAMGKSGTDVAREAAELVISDDNFATIVAGVEEGRVAYDNVRKVIYLLVSTGAAELLIVLLAVGTGLPIPLLPVQLLWVNLVTNGIQDVALAFEPKEGDVLNRAARSPRERIFNRLMIERTVLAALVMGGLGFGWFYYLIEAGWSEADARNSLLLLIVLFENVHIGNCRSETRTLFKINPFSNRMLIAGTATAFLLHLGMMYLPAGQALLRTSPVSIEMWAITIGLALSLVLVMELHKLVHRLLAQRASRA